MEIRIFGLADDSIVDGPGVRYTVFVQGCPHHCPGCHNPASHDFAGGTLMDTDGIIRKIGENPLLDGVTLSGGQKQRIAIARTLLKDNNILIFDDSLSAVDTETDAQIRAALRHEQKDVTTLIISHRVTTLSQADLILVLENGQITQQGTHAELCSQSGLYQRINSIQNALEEELTQAKAAEGVN